MSAKYQVIHYSTVTILKILSKEQQLQHCIGSCLIIHIFTGTCKFTKGIVLKDLFRNLNFKNKRKTPSIYM